MLSYQLFLAIMGAACTFLLLVFMPYHDNYIYVCVHATTAWAPASGLAIAELVLDGKSTSVNLDPFDPARFTEEAKGGRGRKRRGTNVGEQW
jgi:glycine/D-amino acid oxidase-like deaminating enzyme